MALINIANGISAAGGAISQTAGTMALLQQKEALEQDSARLANQLATERETGLEGLRQSGATALAQQQQTFQAGQQKSLLASEEGRSAAQIASAEKVAAGNQAVMTAGQTPAEVREAEWLTKASPEEKQAFFQTNLAKAGLPLWMTTSDTPTPANAAPGDAAAAGSLPAASSSGANAAAPSRYNEDVLKGKPPEAVAMIKAMVEGRQAPPTGMAMSKPIWQGMMALANQYDPTFDQTSWAGRVATRKGFADGKEATAITVLNTALGHAARTADSLDKLQNFGGMATPLNAPVNWLEQKFGGEAQTNAQTDVSALSSEARKVFAATGGGNLTELENWEKNFPVDGSPAQQKGALKEFVGLLDSRLQALGDQFNRGMGRADDPLQLLQPSAREAYFKLTGREPENATGYPSGSAPQAAPAAPAQPAALPAAPANSSGPPRGTVVNGHTFLGGNPNDQKSWSAPPQ